MSAALDFGRQPPTCYSCGQPFEQPYCEHVRQAFGAMLAGAKAERTVDDYFADVEAIFATALLEEVDVIVSAEEPDVHSKSRNDLGRYCTAFVPWEPKHGRTKGRS